MYGKIVDGALQYAPNEFVENGHRIIGFTDEFLQTRGYYPVLYDPYPIQDEPVVATESDEPTYKAYPELVDNIICMRWAETTN